jgi:hypothetical protein
MPDPLPRYPLARYAARFSIVAPMAAFLLSCLLRGAIDRNDGTALGWWLNAGAGSLMSLLLAAGLVLGAIALRDARKTGSSETQILALLGITLNVCAVLLTLYVVWIVAMR